MTKLEELKTEQERIRREIEQEQNRETGAALQAFFARLTEADPLEFYKAVSVAMIAARNHGARSIATPADLVYGFQAPDKE